MAPLLWTTWLINRWCPHLWANLLATGPQTHSVWCNLVSRSSLPITGIHLFSRYLPRHIDAWLGNGWAHRLCCGPWRSWDFFFYFFPLYLFMIGNVIPTWYSVVATMTLAGSYIIWLSKKSMVWIYLCNAMKAKVS